MDLRMSLNIDVYQPLHVGYSHRLPTSPRMKRGEWGLADYTMSDADLDQYPEANRDVTIEDQKI